MPLLWLSYGPILDLLLITVTMKKNLPALHILSHPLLFPEVFYCPVFLPDKKGNLLLNIESERLSYCLCLSLKRGELTPPSYYLIRPVAYLKHQLNSEPFCYYKYLLLWLSCFPPLSSLITQLFHQVDLLLHLY